MADLVTIREEPRGATYVALLQFALQRGSLFSLVWRDQLRFSPAAALVAENLQPDLVIERRTDEWPGTRLFGHLAIVRSYRLSPAALSTLAEAARLYAWIVPDRPEDLAFYTA